MYIASLTQYGDGIRKVHLTIESLLKQTVKFDKIVLVLDDFSKPLVTKEIKDLLNNNKNFEILYTDKKLKIYSKFIPTMKKYPNNTIISFDGDVIYHKWTFKKLLEKSKRYPGKIVSTISRFMCQKNRMRYYFHFRYTNPSFNNSLMGVGGVLYPPIFSKIINSQFDKAIALNEYQYNDDIYLWYLAVKNNIKIVSIFNVGTNFAHNKSVKKEIKTGNIGSSIMVGGHGRSDSKFYDFYVLVNTLIKNQDILKKLRQEVPHIKCLNWQWWWRSSKLPKKTYNELKLDKILWTKK